MERKVKVVVCGKRGAGKSTVISHLYYALDKAGYRYSTVTPGTKGQKQYNLRIHEAIGDLEIEIIEKVTQS